MKKLFYIIFVIAIMTVVAGCTPTTDTEVEYPLVEDCYEITSHNSCISYDGTDEALEGSWTLTSQYVSTVAGSINNPFIGRTTSFESQGTYTEDYSTEETEDISYDSITSSCEVVGTLSGTWSTDVELDLDTYDPNDPNSVAEIINYLRITPNGGTPTVTCQATGIEVTSNQASTPLGVGVATGSQYVEYIYSLNEEWTLLTIKQYNQYSGATNIYTFSR